MSNERELAEAARALRAQLEWLRDQGETGLPPAAVPGAGARGAEAARQALAAMATDAQPPRPAAAGSASGSAPQSRPADSPGQVALGSEAPVGLTAVPPASEVRPTLAQIRSDLGDCTRCKLHSGRQNIVFGVGNPDAEIMFVGEGPGRDEDIQGDPFVGAAGQLLNRIIDAMGLRREDVYIANVVKCRPPQNRNPEADEVAACSPFLFAQIAAVRPEIIVGLGKPACATLIGAPLTSSITRMRGRWLDYRQEIPLMPTFHPAYLLRQPAAKRDVWEDMKQVAAKYEMLTGKRLRLASGKRGG